MAVLRPATAADARAIFELRVANRSYLEPWEPDGEPKDLRYTLEHATDWATRPGRYVVVDGGDAAGALSLTNVVDDVSLSSAMVGYWIAQARTGQGLATRAVAEALEIAFGALGLHRVEAGTRVENVASQRVLEHNGFTLVGLLRRHIRIGGEWRDHYLYERLADD